MTAVFLETSALGRILFGEPGWEEIQARLLSATRIVASRLLKVEMERAILRRCQDDPAVERRATLLTAALREVLARIDLVEINRAICESAGKIVPTATARLRTLDAIHLATFRLLEEVDPDIEMLTVDARLRRVL